VSLQTKEQAMKSLESVYVLWLGIDGVAATWEGPSKGSYYYNKVEANNRIISTFMAQSYQRINISISQTTTTCSNYIEYHDYGEKHRLVSYVASIYYSRNCL